MGQSVRQHEPPQRFKSAGVRTVGTITSSDAIDATFTMHRNQHANFNGLPVGVLANHIFATSHRCSGWPSLPFVPAEPVKLFRTALVRDAVPVRRRSPEPAAVGAAGSQLSPKSRSPAESLSPWPMREATHDGSVGLVGRRG